MRLTDKKTLILYNSINFFIPHFKKNGALVSSVFKNIPFLLKLVRKVFRILNLHQDYWYNSWKLELNSIDTVVIFAAAAHLDVFRFINEQNKNIRIIYWYWNPVFRIGLPNKNILYMAEIWSFDQKDCQKHNMQFNTTFYFNTISLKKAELIHDAIFIGIDKGRRKYLENLENKLNKLDISTYFHIVPNKNDNKSLQLKPVAYAKYLTLLSESKAIVDIQPIGQSGLTVRVMESIFLKKKLITNDLSIQFMDFYNPKNIFILGVDDEVYFKKFINTNYYPLSDSIIAKYNFTNWLERFDLL